MFTVRPVLDERTLGTEGWRVLHQDAQRYHRRPNVQAIALIRWALKQRLDGKTVELTPAQLDHLLGGALEPVA